MEQKPNIIVDKTFNFSKEIIKLYINLKNDKIYELASQLFRSGTSIGANVEEAQAAQSKKDFIAKYKYISKRSKRNTILVKTFKRNRNISIGCATFIKRCY